MIVFTVQAQKKYPMQYRFTDTADIAVSLGLQTGFDDKASCSQYIFQLPQLLQKKGFVTASVDSVQMDTASVNVLIFLGKQYRWAKLDIAAVPQELLNSAGYRDKNFKS